MLVLKNSMWTFLSVCVAWFYLRLFPREIQAVMKTRLIESLPGVLPDSLEIHGEDEDQDESGKGMMFIENLILDNVNVSFGVDSRMIWLIQWCPNNLNHSNYKIQNAARAVEFGGSQHRVRLFSSSSAPSPSSLSSQSITYFCTLPQIPASGRSSNRSEQLMSLFPSVRSIVPTNKSSRHYCPLLLSLSLSCYYYMQSDLMPIAWPRRSNNNL